MSARIKAILNALKTEEQQKPAKYQHTYAHYAQLYGKSLRTIKRWAGEGKPLDDPKLMGEFLSPRGRKPDFPPEGIQPVDQGEESSPVSLDETFFAGSGILAAIERLELAERERSGAYFRALATRQPTAVIQNRFKEWGGIVEALRKLALDAPDIRKANELTIDKAEMEAAVGHIFAAFRSAARNLPHRASAKLLAARTREEFSAILDAEVDVLLRTLTEISMEEAAKVEAQPPPPVAPDLEEAAKPAPAPPKTKKRRRKK